jgi:hypothetical protein
MAEWPSPRSQAIEQAPVFTGSESRRVTILTTKYRARKSVTLEVDGQKRRVRKGDLLEGGDPLAQLSDAEPIRVEARRRLGFPSPGPGDGGARSTGPGPSMPLASLRDRTARFVPSRSRH